MTTPPHTLLIDCGNTFIKWSVCQGNDLSQQQAILHKGDSAVVQLKKLVSEQAAYCKTLVMVSVLGEVFARSAEQIAHEAGCHFYLLRSQAQLGGITNAYETPEKLGTDRLVAMIAGHQLAQEANHTKPCIVIDSGTATTIDAVDENGKHLGGVILPGLQLSVQSLSHNTEQLPWFDANQQLIENNGFATETSQAIASGCVLGLAGGIDGICQKMEAQLRHTEAEPVVKIICGGSAALLLAHLNGEYLHYDDLMMLGLKQIAQTMQQ